MSEHALASPSSAETWMTCCGALLAQKNIPDKESEDAALGTAQHDCAAYCLTNNRDAADCIGMVFNKIILDDDMAENVQTYLDQIREIAEGNHLLIENKLPIEHITGERGAKGTADAVIISAAGDVISISDAKFGYSKVYAKRNKQMMIYALAAVDEFSAFGDFKIVTMRIHQPRINSYDDWTCAREELEKFRDEVQFKADTALRLYHGVTKFIPEQDLIPSDKGCKWCRAQSTCVALQNHVMSVMSEDFVDLTNTSVAKIEKNTVKLDQVDNVKLSKLMQSADMIESFLKAVRARVESELFAGRGVLGYKLVEGKKGNRKWEDESLAEKAMKDLAIPEDDIYTKEVISVSKAEKLLSKKEPKKWAKLHEFITQNEGKPSVAPSTDPRPALQIGNIADSFEVIED